MKKLLIASLFLLSSIGLFAQDSYLKDASEAEVLSENVTKLFGEGEITKAFDLIIPYWPLPKNELESIREQTLKYSNVISQRFGAIIGTLKVKEEMIGDIAIRETYLLRHKFSAIRLIFTYYKSDEGWLLNSFKWDDSFTDEFKEK